MKSGIYKIENTENGTVYVGSATSFVKRFSAHRAALKRSAHGNSKLQRAWNKYGESSFIFSIIEYVVDKNDLVRREQYWIDKLDSVRHGYNIAPIAGSSLGRTASEETRAKLSAVNKGRKPHANTIKALVGRYYSPETRKKISDGLRGKRRPKQSPEHIAARIANRIGKKMSDEARKNMSLAQKGRKFSEESRAKMSASHIGKRPTPEARARQSEAQMGRKVSDETRAKISSALTGVKRAQLSHKQKALLSSAMKGRVWTQDEIARRVETRAKNRASKIAAQAGKGPQITNPPSEPAGRAEAGRAYPE